MLEEYIAQSDLSRREWAARLGITPSYLSLIISGHKLPSLRVAGRIEEATDGKVRCSDLISAFDGEAPDQNEGDAA